MLITRTRIPKANRLYLPITTHRIRKFSEMSRSNSVVAFSDFHKDIDRMFRDFSRGFDSPLFTGSLTSTIPQEATMKLDVVEKENEFGIHVDLPGVPKENVKVTVDNGVMTIEAERKQETKEENDRFHRVERYYGKQMRSLAVPDNVDASKISAKFENGELNLTLPKTASIDKHQITIN